MPNTLDYLAWRGDVPFSLSGVNEVDRFILSKIGVLILSGLVPEDERRVSLRQAAEDYFAAGGELRLGVLISDHIAPAVRQLPYMPRYADVALSGYRRRVSEERTEQFSALTVHLPDGETLITFRGTDDTLVGWKENFLMTIMEAIPAQRDALAYLRWAAGRYDGPLTLAGHSKGGNLAVYAAAGGDSALQDRIAGVYCFDSPGFQESFLAGEGYRRIRDRLRFYVPQNTTVGALLFQEGDYEIVRCNAPMANAHDGFRWETGPTGFVRCDALSPGSRAFDRGMKSILNGMSMERRREFIESFFGTLAATGAETLTDITEQRLRRTLLMLRSLSQEPEVRRMMLEMLETLTREYAVQRSAALLPKFRLPRASAKE